MCDDYDQLQFVTLSEFVERHSVTGPRQRIENQIEYFMVLRASVI